MHSYLAGTAAGSLLSPIAHIPIFSTASNTLPAGSTTAPIASTSITPAAQQDKPGAATTDKDLFIFSPNTPPIPAKLAERIWKGEYINMAMLLPESLSAALAADDQANTEKKKKGKNRKIKSILAWTECFLTYMGVVLAKQPERLLDLLGYANLIVHAARQFEGTQWQVYDTF